MKYLPLTLIFLFSPLLSANMDDTCFIIFTGERELDEIIKEKGCVRNNILHVMAPDEINGMPAQDTLLFLSSVWCRFDRNRDILGNQLSCVLYSNKRRGVIHSTDNHIKIP